MNPIKLLAVKILSARIRKRIILSLMPAHASNLSLEAAYEWVVSAPLTEWHFRMWCITHAGYYKHHHIHQWVKHQYDK